MNDPVDRQSVINILLYFNAPQQLEMIKKLPSIQPERKKGKWIVDEDGNIECSVCGHHGVGDLYCERCGAKMDEKETGDE